MSARTVVLAPSLLIVAATSVLVAPPAPAAQAGRRYVALGDSFAAGLGLTAADQSKRGLACGRSTSNYPHQVAKALGLALVDVTCSSAVVADLSRTQHVSKTTIPAQFDALTPDTRLVTLTIGLNDLGFISVAGYCVSLSGADGPVRGGDDQAPDCTSHFVVDGTDTLARKLTDTVRPALTTALATIKQRSPHAAVVVVDYPAIVPDAAHTASGGCWSSPLRSADALPFATTDLPYLQKSQAGLDSLLADTAEAAGAGVGSTYAASLAHTACGAAPWVNGARLSGSSFERGSLHPDAAGAAAMAAATVPVARGLLAGTSSTSSSVPTWVWFVVAAGVVALLLIGLGVFRVGRRRSRV